MRTTGIIERLRRFDTWFGRLADPPLEIGEVMLERADAFRKPGFDVIFGRLFLTNKRVVFVPDRARLLPAPILDRPVYLPLDGVAGAAKFVWKARLPWVPRLPGVHPNMTIVLRNGDVQRFGVSDPARWICAINSQIQSPPDLRDASGAWA